MPEKTIISAQMSEDILNLLQDRGWPVYEYYKPSSINRRLQTCIEIINKEPLDKYFSKLESDPNEVDKLANAILVGVTLFFRDIHVFQAVRRQVVIPLLKKQLQDKEEIRIWSAACSTGQEAYSLAIMFLEEAEVLNMKPNIRFFASDVSSDAIKVASLGEYDDKSLEGLSANRRRRWFTQESSCSWKVKRELRRMITFVRHDLTRDPPFPRMDLIFARNLLIYLNSAGQKRLHSIFHFSLKPDGTLVVGDNEMTGAHNPLFIIYDAKNRLFKKNNDIKKDEQYHRSISTVKKADIPIFSNTQNSKQNNNIYRDRRYMNNQGLEITETWLSRHGQAGLLMNDEERILFTFGDIWNYIPPPRGLMTDISLHHLPCDTMRITLREGIHRAADKQQDVELFITNENEDQKIIIRIEPFKMPWGDSAYAIVFHHDDGTTVSSVFKAGKLDMDEATRLHIKSLEESCSRLKLELESEREQRGEDEEKLQAANEELRASNEEQQSINEELRATTDELTTKVKELTAANIEIKRHRDLVAEMESEKSAILTHLSEGIMYLDNDYSCQWANPELLKMTGVDDLTKLKSSKCYKLMFNLDKPCPSCPVKNAIKTGKVQEVRNTCLPNNRNYWLTAVPILNENGSVRGVVQHLRDITEQAKLIADLQKSREEYASIIQDQSEFIVRYDKDMQILFLNDSYREFLSAGRKKLPKCNFLDNVPGKNRKTIISELAALTPKSPTITHEYPVELEDGSSGWQHWTTRAIFNSSGALLEYQGTGLDLTHRRHLEQDLTERERLFRGIYESSPIAIELYDKYGKLQHVNPACIDMFKIVGGEEQVQGFDLFSDPNISFEDCARIKHGEIVRIESEFDFDKIRQLNLYNTSGTGKMWWNLTVSPLLSGQSPQPEGYLVQIVDITKRKRAEMSLRESEQRMKLAVESTGLGMWEWLPKTDDTIISDKLLQLTGYTRKTYPYTRKEWLNCIHPEDRAPAWTAIEDHLTGQTPMYQIELRFKHATKGWIWLYVLGSIVELDNNDQPYRIIGFMQDITPLKTAERRWRDALEGVGDGIWDWKLDNNEIYFSSNWYTMVGYVPYEFPATYEEWRKRVHPDDIRQTEEIFDAYKNEKLPEYHVEFRFMCKDGSWKWLLTRGSIIERNNQGKPTRMLGTHLDINDRKNNQLRLTQYTEQLQIAQRLSKIGYFQHEKNSDSLHFSEDFPDMLNISSLRGNVKVSEIIKRIPLSERKDFLKKIEKVNNSKTPSSYETPLQIIDDDGNLRYLHAYGQINEDNNLVYGAIQDVTEKKKTELMLRESEKQLRNIFDNAPMGIALFDSAGKITICNNALAKKLDYSQSELLQMDFQAITHPDDLESSSRLFHSLSPENPAYDIVKRYIKRNGDIIWASLRIALLQTESSYCIGLITDITDKLAREAEIERNKNVLRELQRGLADVTGRAFFERMTLLLNENLGIDYCIISEMQPHSANYAQTLIIRGPEGLLNNFKYPLRNTPCEKVFDGLNVVCIELVKDKYDLPPSISDLNPSGYIGIPMRSPNGKLLGILWALSMKPVENPDFIEQIMSIMAVRATAELERQTYETELILAREHAEASNRTKSSFLANMGHEIRTPLNAIIGYSELLELNADSPRVKKEAHSILTAGNALLKLINDILDLSRIEAGRMVINQSPTNFSHILAEVNAIFQQQAINKGISLKIFYDRSIEILMLDQHRLLQIFINLIGNAIKFTEQGSVTINVQKAAETEDTQTIRISIEDTGIGIAETDLERIFDSFEQADDSPTRHYEGTGLGLTITRQLVELMSGTIELSSQLERGSTFTVEITAEISKGTDNANVSFLSDHKITRRFEAANVLLADDFVDNLTVIGAQLESLGLTPLAASSGKEALMLAAENNVDLALVDIRLQDISGIDLVQQLHSINKLENLPVLAISASYDSKNKASRKYFTEVLEKPISISTLANVLSKYLLSFQTSTDITTITTSLDWLLPVEYSEAARLELLPLLDEFDGGLAVNKLKDVAAKINAFAEHHKLPPMKRISTKLYDAIENFDIAGIDAIKEKLQTILED